MGTHCSKEKGERERERDGTLVQRTEELPCSAHEHKCEKSRAVPSFLFLKPSGLFRSTCSTLTLEDIQYIPLKHVNIGKNSKTVGEARMSLAARSNTFAESVKATETLD